MGVFDEQYFDAIYFDVTLDGAISQVVQVQADDCVIQVQAD